MDSTQEAGATPQKRDGRRRHSTEVDTSGTWRTRLEVSISKSRKIRGSNYVQLATVDASTQEPRCRTVVFRGFLQTLPANHPSLHTLDSQSCLMKMCTDLRSKKASETVDNPVAELVWWFPKSSEQYRVRGKLLLLGADETDKDLQIARKELWGNLSDPARESFLGPSLPGQTFVSESDDTVDANIPKGGRNEEGKVVPPPANFLLMLLDPFHVDYLRLTGDQFRQVDSKSSTTGTWSLERVNP